MGTWGYGILQNDTAQDSLCEIARNIEEDISELDTGSEANAAMLGAAVGVLLMFSPYSFNPESPFYPTLIKALEINKDFFYLLHGNCHNILMAVLAGQGLALALRPGALDPNLDTVLHGDEEPHDFPTQKAFSFYEEDLFHHSAALTYTQQLVDRLIDEVDDGFSDEEMVSDLSREGYFMGAFALLLVLQPIYIAPNKFIQWQRQVHSFLDKLEIEEDDPEREFTEKYNRLLDLAFEYGIKKFSK